MMKLFPLFDIVRYGDQKLLTITDIHHKLKSLIESRRGDNEDHLVCHLIQRFPGLIDGVVTLLASVVEVGFDLFLFVFQKSHDLDLTNWQLLCDYESFWIVCQKGRSCSDEESEHRH